MKRSEFYYDLDPELIAQTPLEKRDSSRLLHLDAEQSVREDLQFSDLINLLNKGDVLVLNDTRVIPARIMGRKEGLKNPVEILLLHKANKDFQQNYFSTLSEKLKSSKFENFVLFEVLVKPGRRLKEGSKIDIIQDFLEAEVIACLENGNRLVCFFFNGIWEEVLDKAGTMPLPHYIHERLDNPERYQTIYSKFDGSVAAPTAGLHFTESLLKALKEKGVAIAYVTLHVGIGTFRPVQSETIEDHVMHHEFYRIDEENASLINKIRSNGGRVIAVGTTSCRTLESVADEQGFLKASSGDTGIFIYPPYKFKIVDALVTNFHLPESTLLMLVSALAGQSLIMDTYKYAVSKRYRFFSLGDAMFIEANHHCLRMDESRKKRLNLI